MLKLTVIFILFFLGIHIANAQDANQDIKLPPIGKWLERDGGTPADWLGKKYKNKQLLEPINVVIIDEHSQSREQAIQKLTTECKKQGYKAKHGHSCGYFGQIDSTLFAQITAQKKVAFSNKIFIKTNNHGRIMGPAYYDGKYIFVAAFSRESFRLLGRIHHSFRSFTIARNDFCQKLAKRNVYKIMGRYNLANRVDDDCSTTADHDGEAIMLYANK